MAERLLEIPASLTEEALNLELEAGEVVADEVDARRRIFLARFHRAERAIADRRRALQEGVLPWPHIDPVGGHPMGRGQNKHRARREQGARRQGHGDRSGGADRTRGQAAEREHRP